MTDEIEDHMDGVDPEIEHSVHSGFHTHNGIEVEVCIFRIAGTDEPWTLEVVNKSGGSTTWDDTFPTDDSAYSEFLATLAKEGIEQFEFDEPTMH